MGTGVLSETFRWTCGIFLCVLSLGSCGADEETDKKAKNCASSVDGSSTLFESGLYCDADKLELGKGVRQFAPNYELWSDGATKKRWVFLPENETINTEDMDFWELPVGTKLWKEFSKDGLKIETRLLERHSTETSTGWSLRTFAWNLEQNEALDTMGQEVVDALGTSHDIPDLATCRECHTKDPSMALGFTAIQLDRGTRQTNNVSLGTLVDEKRLSHAPQGGAPYFELPGDDVARAALGALHGNCGNCHNDRTAAIGNGINLRLQAKELASLEQTPTYLTTINVPSAVGPDRIEPGNPEESAIYQRMSLRPRGMPPVATDEPDADTLMLLRSWICSLADCSGGPLLLNGNEDCKELLLDGEDFADTPVQSELTLWALENLGVVTRIQDQKLRVELNIDAPISESRSGGLKSVATDLNLINKRFFIKLEDIPFVNRGASVYIGLHGSNNSVYSILIENDQLKFIRTLGGEADWTVLATTTYTPATQRYFQLRADAQTIYADVGISPNQWTTLAFDALDSVAKQDLVSSMSVQINAGYTGNQNTVGLAMFDDFNVGPACQ